MSADRAGPEEVDQAALIAEFDAEKPARTLSGRPLLVVQALGVALTGLAIWQVFRPQSTQFYLPLFLGLALAMTFLVYRGWGRSVAARDETRVDNPPWYDWILAAAALVPLAYIAIEWQTFFRRAVRPTELDLVMGTVLVVLIFERRDALSVGSCPSSLPRSWRTPTSGH